MDVDVLLKRLLLLGLLVSGDAWVCHVRLRDEQRCRFAATCSGGFEPRLKGGDALEPGGTCEKPSDFTLELIHMRGSPLAAPAPTPNYLRAVTDLHLSHDNLTSPPHALLLLTPRLRILDLSNNQIELLTRFSSSPFSHLHKLLYLDLSYNAMTCLEQRTFEFEKESSLVSLNLSHNKLERIYSNTFKGLKLLQLLDLSFNNLATLAKLCFNGLSNLYTLRINNNRIKMLNGALKPLKNLKNIYLGENMMSNFSTKEVPNFEHLKIFDMSKNNLTSVQPEIFTRYFPKNISGQVVKIDLSLNKITTLENADFPNVMLRHRRDGHVIETEEPAFTEIDVSKNDIERVAYDAFQGVVKLTALDLSSNRLVTLKINTNNLENLKTLNLRNNQLKELVMNTFYHLYGLRNLDISNNKIDYIPSNAFLSSNELTNVDLSGNNLQEIDKININSLMPPGILNLSNNMLRKLTIGSTDCDGLKILVLSSNNISDMSLLRIEWHLELEVLDLSKNQIAALHDAEPLHLHKLKTFDLSNNNIESIGHSAFSNLSTLERLDLSHNKLSSFFPGSFQGLGKLTQLDMSWNNIEYLESSLLFELRSLRWLSIEHNGLRALQVGLWRSRHVPLVIEVGGNNELSCRWLAEALREMETGSGVKLHATHRVHARDSIDGIACDNDAPDNLVSMSSSVQTDDRVLMIARQIFQALLRQNKNLDRIDWSLRHVLKRSHT